VLKIFEAVLELKESAPVSLRREMCLFAADALLSFVRTSTNANTLTIDGDSDLPEFRAVWATWAPVALQLLKPYCKEDDAKV
jgi:hypothetical protein